MRSCIPTAHRSNRRKRSASCRDMSLTPGCAWRKCSTRLANPIAHRRSDGKPATCATGSRRASGARRPDHTRSRSMPRSSRSRASLRTRPMPLVRTRQAGSRGPRRPSAAGAGYVERLGHSNAVGDEPRQLPRGLHRRQRPASVGGRIDFSPRAGDARHSRRRPERPVVRRSRPARLAA